MTITPWTARPGWQWRLLGAALVLAVLLAPDLGAATDLTVDNTLFNSPYTVTTDINFANEISGNTSTGTVNQTGFTNTVTNLYLGYSPASSGNYNLSGTGSLAATNQYVGYSGSGVFNQSGGTNSGSVLYLGDQSGSSGVYNLSGGSLSIVGEIIGNSGSGTFNQTGGTHTGNGNLSLGNDAGGIGTYNQSGGINTVAGILFLGYNPGGSGTYNLSGGSLESAFEFIGKQGLGTFNQTGGTNSISSNLYLGRDAGSTGTYNLSGGSLSVVNQLVGYLGSGVFNQSGGSNIVDNQWGSLYLGYWEGSNGAYNLSGGSLAAPFEAIGVHGVGVFTQSGGSNILDSQLGILYVGYLNGGDGTYNLSGGSLAAAYETIGYRGLGVFNQSGGSNALTWTLTLGGSTSGSGTYNLSGGDLSAGSEIIGAFGSGVFTQSGGTNTVTGDLTLGDQPNRLGVYTLSGGSLFTANTIVGNGGNGTFTQTGGSHTVSNTLTLAAIPGSSGTYNLLEGSLTAGTVNLNPGGTFNQTGGNLNAATFNHQGGTVEGALLNHGTFNYSSGAFSGRLLNYGAVNFNADFTAANGLANYSGIGIAAGRTVTLNGQGLDNQGSLVVNGTLIGGGPLLNDTTGLLAGAGTLQGAFTNRGTVNPGNSVGTLNVEGSYTQTASGILQVEIASATSYDQLRITGLPGTASLNGALTPKLLNGYRPQAGQVFEGVVSAAGGISGAFIPRPNFTPTLVGQFLYAANRVDLLVQRDYTNPFLAPLTRNQYVVGDMLNGLANTASGDLNTVLTTIDNLPDSSSVRNAYQQISPDKAAALSTLAFAGANLQKRILSRRITDLRFGDREISATASLPGAFNLNYSQAAGLMLAYNSSSLAGLLTSERQPGPAASESRLGVYLDPAMILGSQKSSVDQTGFNFTIAGFNAGADYRVRDNLRVGLATGYSHTGASFHGSGGGVTANTWPITAYAAYSPEKFYAYASLGYALNLFNLERQLSFGGLNRTAKSSPTGNQFNAYGEAGYDLKVSRLVVTPVVSLAYSSLWVDGFTESGAGALDLKVSPQNGTSLQTGVGGKVAAPWQRGSVKVVPQVYATYQHESSNSSQGLDARFSQAGNTFTFQTKNPGRNFAVAGANVTIWTRKDFQVRIDYNAEVGRRNYTAHYLNAGLRYEF